MSSFIILQYMRNMPAHILFATNIIERVIKIKEAYYVINYKKPNRIPWHNQLQI